MASKHFFFLLQKYTFLKQIPTQSLMLATDKTVGDLVRRLER